jgi:hypothetical protein
VTGGQEEISLAKAFWVGMGLLIASCLASSIIESWRSSDEPDAVNEERVRRAAEGPMGEPGGPRVHEPSDSGASWCSVHLGWTGWLAWRDLRSAGGLGQETRAQPSRTRPVTERLTVH